MQRKTWLWACAATLLLAVAGGAVYWGWTNKLARDEAEHRLAEEVQRRATADEAKRRAAAAAEETRRAAADEAKRRAAEADAIERAEIAAAQAALDKHIAAEELLAKARAGAK